MLKQHPSKIDSTFTFDENNWCISLICVPKSRHAILVVEGIDALGKDFIKYSHFKGLFSNSKCEGQSGFSSKGRVIAFKELNLKEGLKFRGSASWLRSKAAVEKLMESVAVEAKEQTKAFHILGRNSIFSSSTLNFIGLFFSAAKILENSENFKTYDEIFRNEKMAQPDNCFTWARKKLALADIDLPRNTWGFLFSSTRSYVSYTSSPVVDLKEDQVSTNSY